MLNPKDVGTKYCRNIIRRYKKLIRKKSLPLNIFQDILNFKGTWSILSVTHQEHPLTGASLCPTFRVFDQLETRWMFTGVCQMAQWISMVCFVSFQHVKYGHATMCHESVGKVVCVCVCQCPQIASNARSFLLRSRYTGLSGLKEAVQVAQLPCCIGLATSYMPLLDLTTKRWDFLMHHSTSRNHNGINILGVLHLGQMGHWHTCIIISEASFLLDYSRTMN